MEIERDTFIANLLTKCKDGTYYFGPHKVQNLDCAATGRNITNCAELIEYAGFELAQALRWREDLRMFVEHDPIGTLDLKPLPADKAADIEKKVLLLVKYVSSRSRMRVTYSTFWNSPAPGPAHRDWAPEWDPWQKPVLNAVPSAQPIELLDNQDKDKIRVPAGTRAFGLMILKKNGQWIFAPGPDFPMQANLSQTFARVGLGGGPAVDSFADSSRGLGLVALMTPISGWLANAGMLEKIASEKPKSCEELARWIRESGSAPLGDALPPSAPGHSLSDTYTRLREIERENASKGIRDDVRDFVGLRTFYSTGKDGWRRAPELVYVPGDLATPLDWGPLSDPGLCRSRPPLVLEVRLKAAPNENRYIDCLTAGLLAKTRKRLLDLGVKAESPPRESASVQETHASAPPPTHSLSDTYERTMQIIDEHARNGIPDRVHANLIPFAYACSAITGTGQCQRTGEVVRVPGDLAEPLNWDLVSQMGYCANRLAIGVAVVLKNPAQNDGKKRFLRCSDAVRLGQFFKYLVQLGVK